GTAQARIGEGVPALSPRHSASQACCRMVPNFQAVSRKQLQNESESDEYNRTIMNRRNQSCFRLIDRRARMIHVLYDFRLRYQFRVSLSPSSKLTHGS